MTTDQGTYDVSCDQGHYDYDYVKPADTSGVLFIGKTKTWPSQGNMSIGRKMYFKLEEQKKKRRNLLAASASEIFFRVRSDSLRTDEIVVNPQLTYVIGRGRSNPLEVFLIDVIKRTVSLLGNDNMIKWSVFDEGMFEWSPDGKYLAIRVGDFPWESEFCIMEAASNKIVFGGRLGKNSVGFAWSPDSKFIAVLYEFGDVEVRSIGDLIGKIAGHPSSYYTFCLAIFDLNNIKVFESEIVKDVINGGGRIIWVGDENQM
jgi:hypothetical protein